MLPHSLESFLNDLPADLGPSITVAQRPSHMWRVFLDGEPTDIIVAHYPTLGEVSLAAGELPPGVRLSAVLKAIEAAL